MKNVNVGYELVDIHSLRVHPKNPKKGDVAAIGGSIDANGFYGALIVQKSTRFVLAGNHRLHAAFGKGAKKLPVIWVDVDDETALRILLADNRTCEIASIDFDKLVELLESASKMDDGLAGTGYSPADLDHMIQRAIDPGPVNSGTFDVLITTYSRTDHERLAGQLRGEGYAVEEELATN